LEEWQQLAMEAAFDMPGHCWLLKQQSTAMPQIIGDFAETSI
jgi:hypothetical protein